MRDLSVNLGAGMPTPTGDWATVTDLEARRAGLLRRLTTPHGAVWYDRTYGNPAYARLSEPATSTWLQAVAVDFRRAAEREAGVQVIDVQLQPDGRQVKVKLSLLWDGAASDSLSLSLREV